MFKIGSSYTRKEINNIVGGSMQVYLPTKIGEVVAACHTMRNPFFLDSESGFEWTVNPVFTGQCFQHFLPAVRVGIGCPV